MKPRFFWCFAIIFALLVSSYRFILFFLNFWLFHRECLFSVPARAPLRPVNVSTSRCCTAHQAFGELFARLLHQRVASETPVQLADSTCTSTRPFSRRLHTYGQRHRQTVQHTCMCDHHIGALANMVFCPCARARAACARAPRSTHASFLATEVTNKTRNGKNKRDTPKQIRIRLQESRIRDASWRTLRGTCQNNFLLNNL